MTKKSTESVAASSPTWGTLETFARHGMQQFLQQVLAAEVHELLVRGRYERRARGWAGRLSQRLWQTAPAQLEQRDDGTGLMYLRARYYHPTRQRFISEDPIGFRGGLNLYAYVMNARRAARMTLTPRSRPSVAPMVCYS